MTTGIFTAAVLGVAALTAGLAGCAQAVLLAERQKVEAERLQEYCRKTGVAGPETQRADTLLAMAQKHIKDGDQGAAQDESDLSVTLYRLALALKDLSETEAQVEILKQSLAKEKDQLLTYRQILEEIKP